MDTISILRDLWSHRLAVLGVLALSVLAGLLVLYKVLVPLELQSRRYDVGVATTRVLIDTPSSQVAEINPEGSGELGLRADLLARIMVEGAVKARIAKQAGLRPTALYGRSTTSTAEAEATTPPAGAPVLRTEVVVNNDGTQLPLIEIEAQAADAAAAAKLADAAVVGLRDYVDRQAADTQVPQNRRVRVAPLGATQAETVARGPKAVFAFAAGIFVFLLGCGFIVGLSALAGAWSSAIAREQDQWADTDVAWLEVRRVADGDEPPAPVAASAQRQRSAS